MQFKSTLAFLTVLSAVASSVLAGPGAAPEFSRRQPGCAEVFFPNKCPSSMPNKCSEAGAIMICCRKCP
ncbi:hypothetical protein PM082_003930 [Marasmius tenuissimus]|nr:hypothetical protein PM082_003930 [Marasmius tenuissimus]